jgi:hypothetical protein
VNDLHPSKLGEDQDNWAIAVALFMLLNFDLHPYDGKASSSVKVTAVDDFVRMGLYAYGYKSNPLVTPKKSSVHELWPREIRELFDRAFTNPQKSPQMAEWADTIANILQNKKIARCETQRNSVDHIKFLGFECMQCAYESRQKPKAKRSPARAKPPYQPPQIPTRINPPFNAPKKLSGDTKLMLWIAGVVGLIILFNLSPKNKQQANTSTQQSQQQTNVSNPHGLVQLPSRARAESFIFYGNTLRVPDDTSQLNAAETRWCAYEFIRLRYFSKEGGIGKINANTLARQQNDFDVFCFQKDGQHKIVNINDTDSIVIKAELNDQVLLSKLKQTYNLR